MENANESSPADTNEFLGTQPFRSRQRDEPECHLDVSVWRCSRNVCEDERHSSCDTLTGTYYGSAEDEVTKFCPRHFYEMHFGPRAPYELFEPEKALPPEKECHQCPRPAEPGNCRCRYCILEVEASEAFWDVIARHYPEAKYGDLSPERTIRQRVANVDAIEEWISNNVLPQVQDGDDA